MVCPQPDAMHQPDICMQTVCTLSLCSPQTRPNTTRAVCDLAGVEPEPFQLGDHLVEASGKLAALDALLPQLRRDGTYLSINIYINAPLVLRVM